MAFRVFLSYSLDPREQALAWRLQTLAAAHGIEVFVPPRGTAYAALPSVGVTAAIDRADCVIAIINAKTDAGVQRELKYALESKKLVIPIVHTDFVDHPLLAQFPKIFKFSPTGDPGKLEGEVLSFLKEQDVSKKSRQAVGGLVALGVGLLLLSSLAKK